MGFLLLFPTFWLLKAKFLLIFCDFLEILQLFFESIFRLVLKILENFLDIEDFRKFVFNFQKMSLFLTSETFEPYSVAEIVNKAKSYIAAKILFETVSSKWAEVVEKLDKMCGHQISFETSTQKLLKEVL